KKVKKMYTDPGHLRIEDPGKVEGNPVISYLDACGTDLEKIQELKAHYSKGGLGDGTVKKYLLEVLLEFLEPIHKKRSEYEKDSGAVMEFLRKGTEKANETASKTLSEVKEAVGILYF
ncbi:MAG: tryptophan--tRNA ligase, partial [Simkania sp.]|nr:tryptophan--tRNA ligase [Simkania sp.]